MARLKTVYSGPPRRNWLLSTSTSRTGVCPPCQPANFLAMKVITQFGARLHHGTRPFWDEILSSPGG